MPYRQFTGDYYMGDYYMGDPGLFSFLGKAVKFGGSAMKSIGRSVLGLGGASKIKALPPAAVVPAATARTSITLAGRAGALATEAGAIMRQHPVVTGMAGAGMAALAGTAAGRMGMVPAGQQRGFHVSRRTGKVVRNRRMRVTNVKALHRAIRRATGFARIARRVLHFTSPRPPRGRGVFRARRRSKRV